MAYNGWSNYETWLVSVWFGDLFADMANEGVKMSYRVLKDTVEELMDSEGTLPETGFAADIINAALSAVDWDELAEHYSDEEEEEEEDEYEESCS